MGFILGTTYEMYLWFDKITKQGYFMSGHNVFFFCDRKRIKIYSPLIQKNPIL